MSKTKLGIIRLYCGNSGCLNYYNVQELGLAREYKKHNYIVYIIILQKGNRKTYYQKIDEAITIVYPATISLSNHGIFNVKIISSLKLDLVHLNSDNQFFVPFVLNYCRRHGIESYNYVGMLFSHTSKGLKGIIGNICSKRNLKYYKKYPTAAKTENIKKQLGEHGIANSAVIPVGLDINEVPGDILSKEKVRKELNLPLNKKILLFIGRMEEEKRPLDAVKLLDSLNDNFVLVMIGEGKLVLSVNKLIQDMHLQARVYRILKVENHQIYKYYQSADYFINLCTNEAWGMCILEAMYYKCLVIAVRAPGPNNIIVDGETGFLVNNLEGIKALLERDIDRQESICKQAYEDVCNKYLWKQSYKKLEKFRENIKRHETEN